ncbi:MAG TPA: alginate lyase family protein, partial [Gemmatimonadales bacterium]|nr:alginate lyase family protein [Gemmatimonadales bacterium]
MLTAEELEARSQLLEESADLGALVEHLSRRVHLVVKRNPPVPPIKGMLTGDGGICPGDGVALLFDPWSPVVHKCPRCGAEARGERHDQRWAWHQHLWLAERIAEAATVGVLTNDTDATDWAVQKLEEYAERYFDLPNRDNVLGPTHLFSSTYLESIWLTNYLAAAYLLREAEVLLEPTIDAVSKVADEAGNLIGEFDERLSNRQTWHNAALTAAAVWFGDEDLATRAIQGSDGLVGHLVDGFGPDGMWYEGENYHLFALRGLLVGAWWARLAGVDLFEEEAGQRRLIAALRAPMQTALPDGTFPARKDSRFGVSLAQPMYLELWEAGLAFVNEAETAAMAKVSGWLAARYNDTAPPAQLFDSYLHEAGEAPPSQRSRANLSAWMLLVMLPELPASDPDVRPLSVLLPEQGLAVLRGPSHYVSLECGAYGGGHGHPDRLHLSL